MKYKLILTILLILIPVVVIGCRAEEETAEIASTIDTDTLRVAVEIGVEMGDSTNTFALISDALIDQHDRILVLDEIEACIKVYDLQGNYIQQVSRRGYGPGELNIPSGLFMMPDGRFGVIAPSKQGFVVFDDSLQFIEELNLWEENSPYHVTPVSNNRIVACGYDEISRDDIEVLTRIVAIYSWDEAEPDTVLWKDSIEVSFEDAINNLSVLIDYALFNRISTCTDGNGNVYFSPMDPYKYEIIGWDSTGTEIMRIIRDIDPVEKTPEELEYEAFYANSYLERISSGPVPFEFEPLACKILIDELRIGPDGNLWARLGTHNEPFFDVFDLDGNLLKQAILPAEGLSWETEVTPNGILAWEEDPVSGYQVLYLLE